MVSRFTSYNSLSSDRKHKGNVLCSPKLYSGNYQVTGVFLSLSFSFNFPFFSFFYILSQTKVRVSYDVLLCNWATFFPQGTVRERL